MSLGDALLTSMVTTRSCIWTLPAPPPPPSLRRPGLVSPQLNDSSWISPLCFASADSPGTPSIFRK